ncbi:putative glutamate--cysteine ligase 2 [Streptomyces longisporoflavus]|uniref:carboxylate-amine ligase n=1 Tax=Streptomyces longisporoflavus TaxID=28044 RepID=UPI00167E566F|nr:glutamate--cysteine ligase [Streptomyces longisporoflavus]GGV66508.1 putative glutamate--cysteine ligase 2 [Streptomyces longisporoflavus]
MSSQPHGGRSATDAHAPQSTRHSRNAAGPLTVGIEEELLLIDPVTRELSPLGPELVREAVGELGDRTGTELTRYQVELRTGPHVCLREAGEQIRTARRTLADSANRLGLRIASTGTPVQTPTGPVLFTPGPRYAQSVAHYRALDDEQIVCACHIHVGLPDVRDAFRVSNHLRPWLPVLTAMTANSPFWGGQDTGYASWRTTSWGRWPVAGPPPYLESPAHLDELVEALIRAEALIDRAGLYWDIRPSHHLPTLEVRVADAALTPDDSTLLAAVVRALTATALTAITAGEPPPRLEPELLRAACWRAARDGLSGKGIDLSTGRLVAQKTLAERLLHHVAPALDRHGDLGFVRGHWRHLRMAGTGADRQRAAYHRRSSTNDLIDYIIAATCPA